MGILEGQLATITKNTMKKVMEDKGYAFFEEGDYNLNIIGIRNASGRADRFDDNMIVLYKDNGKWMIHSYEITTEPGHKILKRPINSKGTAILIPDQYRGAYRIGTHKTYTALIQRGAKVKVWRDDNRDSKPDYKGEEDEGWYGINIHKHAGSDTREDTGGVSAGCQVFRSSKDFYEFMDLCDIAADTWSNSFTYTLLNSEDVYKEEKV